MNCKRNILIGLALGIALLSGCSAGMPKQVAVQPGPSQPVTASTAVPTPVVSDSGGAAPAAAAMVCSSEAQDNVTKILGLKTTPAATPSWDGRTYSCHYQLPEGSFTMTVEVMEDDAAATTSANTLAAELKTTPITGLSNLGLPGYQTTNGTVIFAKDNMVLHVDATAMTAAVGTNKVPKADFAYQMATTILACWTEH